MPVDKHNAEMTAKKLEIENLKSQKDSTDAELTKLKKEFKDVEGFSDAIKKLQTENAEKDKVLESTKKSYTIKEAVKDAYRDLGVNAEYLDYVIGKENPELEKVELKEGKFVIDTEKVKTLKEKYKAVIGITTVKGFTPDNGNIDTSGDAEFKKYNVTQQIELKKKDPETYKRVFG
jgi:uncharacterized protein YPO0396